MPPSRPFHADRAAVKKQQVRAAQARDRAVARVNRLALYVEFVEEFIPEPGAAADPDVAPVPVDPDVQAQLNLTLEATLRAIQQAAMLDAQLAFDASKGRRRDGPAPC